MRWASGIAIFVLLLVAGAAVIAVVSRLPHSEVALPPAPAAEAPALPPPAVGSQWRYTAPRSASSAQAGVEACTRSQRDIAIGGGAKSGAMLCLRRGGGYPYAGSIVLADTRGRFVCADCPVRATFDRGGTQTLDGTAASSDGTAYALFFRNGPRLAAALKRASTVTFAVTIHGAGDEDVTFNVAGLKWD